MSYLRVTEWSLSNPSDSPGWLKSSEIADILLNPSLVPAQFYNEIIYSEYLSAYLVIISDSASYPGLLGYRIFDSDKFSVLSVVEFSTLEILNAYLATYHGQSSYNDVYVPARDAMMGLLNVSMIIHNPVETTISVDSLTEAEVRQLIA